MQLMYQLQPYKLNSFIRLFNHVFNLIIIFSSLPVINVKAGSKLGPDQIIYTSIKSNCAQPSGIFLPCQYRGLGISKFCMAWGSGIWLHVSPHPRAFDMHMVTYPNNTKHGGLSRKHKQIGRLDRTNTGKSGAINIREWTFFLLI